MSRLVWIIGFFVACWLISSHVEAQGLSFKKAVLDSSFRSEGVAVGDFNKDGKLDIAAGAVWYQSPD